MQLPLLLLPISHLDCLFAKLKAVQQSPLFSLRVITNWDVREMFYRKKYFTLSTVNLLA